MAGFRTHITVSSLAGVGYGAGAHLLFDMPVPTCLLAGGLCGVAGMLPDIDSDSGRPLRECHALAQG
ncbi:MAG: metal-dependent hydrolase, partial [Planctomycetota bacterium]|nr:metal-dependent hydrolase [Planctomycetota bacterium]